MEYYVVVPVPLCRAAVVLALVVLSSSSTQWRRRANVHKFGSKSIPDRAGRKQRISPPFLLAAAAVGENAHLFEFPPPAATALLFPPSLVSEGHKFLSLGYVFSPSLSLWRRRCSWLLAASHYQKAAFLSLPLLHTTTSTTGSALPSRHPLYGGVSITKWRRAH